MWTVLDAVDEALLLIDDQQRLLGANRRFWDLFALAPTTELSAVRQHVLNCMADPDLYLRLAEHQDEDEEVELELQYPDERVVRRRVSRLAAEAEPPGWLVSYRDVTRDAEVNRLKTEFVSNVSHELRTPMAAIKGFLGVVLEDEESLAPPMRRKFLTIARAETDRLSRLIDDLLDISRIEAGRRARLDTTFVVADLLHDALVVARLAARDTGIEVSGELPPADWTMVADRDQLSQVLANLLGNAVKFAQPGGQVRLSAVESAGELCLVVSDTGCGIAKEDLPHIFAKFYRCRASGIGPRGTGLGLAIARELVEAHEGRIEVSSDLGVGSTFRVCLPWQREGGSA
ncbi:MAG: hypothetical protein HZB16_01750 [Armatimonadetes bacterium]|nr:hypothetical protein [Armatimonadota bacterium]